MKRSYFLWIIRGMVGLLALLALFSQPIQAKDEQVLQLRQKVSELEAKVEELEGLLNECIASRKREAADEYGWQNKMNWRRLEMGMSQAQVQSILGEPTKVIKGVKTLWYYPNIYGGFVSFDQSGNIVGWNEP
ncbi:MAG: outer membrane protein assembly factor BamE [Desulfobacteraceae bacterium]